MSNDEYEKLLAATAAHIARYIDQRTDNGRDLIARLRELGVDPELIERWKRVLHERGVTVD